MTHHDRAVADAHSALATALAVLLIIGGIGVFSYPLVANMLADREHAEVIRNYGTATSELDPDEKQRQLQLAQEYNDNLAGDPLHDPFVEGSGYALPTNYNDVLNLAGDGVMGTLTIPKIALNLPIYHGIDEETLEQGVGHMSQTALPIGGIGTRSVLTGHRGLPSAELFTRLDELDTGDLFTITVLGDTLAYRVVDIDVVTPDKINEILPDPDRDLVTLVTCTPYAVNTHRLLVTGERTDYDPDDPDLTPTHTVISARSWDTWLRWGGVSAAVTIGAIAAAILHRRRARNAARGDGGTGGNAVGAVGDDDDDDDDGTARDGDATRDGDGKNPTRDAGHETGQNTTNEPKRGRMEGPPRHSRT
ncbi:class C sortase [Bifidobacterium samirii]|uniref:Sortase n=1 Tax=Bifidobacterium samirii TaxID=2306974 RepID=A0A430FR84_9BIFI|nr:class C sortase [Bifidobacterium samirii]RSX55336.1 sortase [Bifidobacterium samirii]